MAVTRRMTCLTSRGAESASPALGPRAAFLPRGVYFLVGNGRRRGGRRRHFGIGLGRPQFFDGAEGVLEIGFEVAHLVAAPPADVGRRVRRDVAGGDLALDVEAGVRPPPPPGLVEKPAEGDP